MLECATSIFIKTGERHLEEQVSYTDLQELGRIFFGPILAPFILHIADEMHTSAQPWIMVSREGYFLGELVRHVYRKKYNDVGITKANNLLTSRRLLYTLCLSDPKFYTHTLWHHFNGTVEHLLKTRFQIDSISSSRLRGILSLRVELPREAQLVRYLLTDILLENQEIVANAKAQKAIFERVFREMVPGDFFNCVDLGYSGSLQRMLGALYECESQGFYLLLNKPSFDQGPSRPGSHASGFLSENAVFGSGKFLIDASLVLEGILTAPHGPVNAVFEDSYGGVSFEFGETGKTQEKFHLLLGIMDGVKSYLEQALKSGLSSTELRNMIDPEKHYQLQLLYNRSPAMRALISFLDIDDLASGNRFLAPFQFLPILNAEV